ncbi:MAG: glutamine--fructose-6-phosphate transaminase (isomerizing) [Spirochaetaceae bacterium]|jgi:glucosamine--fructose-6-phosphate aminotransferase (isomerizing)|nr:glutamine--fructose-6-phosphate transaminase (isomerizing) [Spirochaetaceae bacterium]
MCGIVGYCGGKQASEVLLSGLKRLEYRGYDSSGISVNYNHQLTIIKKTGKIKNLKEAVPSDLGGHSGIGHTRWATHGGVTDQNAHPHSDSSSKIAVVHNGIIENYTGLKEKLVSEGYIFKSETDSEVLAHLISKFYDGNLEIAVKSALSLIKGTYGIIVMHADNDNELIGARNGSPLVLGVGDNEMFLASDVSAILAYTKQVVYFEDGEIVRMTSDGFTTSDIKNNKVSKEVENISWELEAMEKGSFSTYMEKEIHEQVESIPRAYKGRIDEDIASAILGGLNLSGRELLDIERVKIIAAGTSFYAGQVASYLIESLARIPCSAELASEFRYRNPVVEKNTLYFAISQSGETIDTLFALREIKRKGGRVLGICNVVGSTIPRESDGGVYIHSGPEISVASTKAFTSQITALYLFALNMARMRNMSQSDGLSFVKDLKKIPEAITDILERKNEIQVIAKKYAHSPNFLFLGRGINFPVAMEGALKLKEVSYIHAEGYSAAEIKHGPIALINDSTPSMFLIPDDDMREKILSNMKEVKARNGKVIAIAVKGDTEVLDVADDVFFVDKISENFYPYLMVVPLQLFSYFCALELKRDVDQPRNLAKSVTVE